MRCLAIDDEPFALEILADDIRRIPHLELVGSFSSPLDASTRLEQEPVDLLFLDIQMPSLTGIQFLRTLAQPPLVIFTTAYEQYALEGFELAVVDYLLKPIPFGRFLKAVNKAYDLFLLRQAATKLALSPAASPSRGFLFVFSEYREVKIFYDEILYIEGLKDYVKIFTTQRAQPLLSRLSLKAVETRLPDNAFCRVHKSFIVPLDRISSFQRTKLFVGPTEIPIGNSYLADFERKYGIG
jgi:DNA-binding LytR/AlgR family response regulator